MAYTLFEEHANPVGFLAEAARVGRGEPWLSVISARRQPNRIDDPRYHLHELAGQINASTGWQVLSGSAKDNPPQPMIVVARHKPAVARSKLHQEAVNAA